MRRGQNRRLDFGVLLLAHQLITSPNNPPVTLACIIAQVAIYLGFVPFLDYDKIHNVCLLPSKIWYGKEWSRLFFASLVHGDDMHLYYNMISFLWKGRRLERKFGSYYFALLLVIFSLTTNVIMTAISILLENEAMHHCAVGFSGVIFALKVLTSHYYPTEDAWLFGWMPVPSKYACWIELIVIQMLVPNASFIGHLSGILIGLAFTMGPLKFIIDSLFSILSDSPIVMENTDGPRYMHYGYRNGRPSNDFSHYTGGLDEEEQLRRATEESRRDFARFRPRPSAPPYESNENRLYPDIH